MLPAVSSLDLMITILNLLVLLTTVTSSEGDSRLQKRSWNADGTWNPYGGSYEANDVEGLTQNLDLTLRIQTGDPGEGSSSRRHRSRRQGDQQVPETARLYRQQSTEEQEPAGARTSRFSRQSRAYQGASSSGAYYGQASGSGQESYPDGFPMLSTGQPHPEVLAQLQARQQFGQQDVDFGEGLPVLSTGRRRRDRNRHQAQQQQQTRHRGNANENNDDNDDFQLSSNQQFMIDSRLVDEMTQWNNDPYYMHEFLYASSIRERTMPDLDQETWQRSLAEEDPYSLQVRNDFLQKCLSHLKTIRGFVRNNNRSRRDAIGDSAEYNFIKLWLVLLLQASVVVNISANVVRNDDSLLVKRSQNRRRRERLVVEDPPDEMTMEEMSRALNLTHINVGNRLRRPSNQGQGASDSGALRRSRHVHFQEPQPPEPQTARPSRQLVTAQVEASGSVTSRLSRRLRNFQLSRQEGQSSRNVQQQSSGSEGEGASNTQQSRRRHAATEQAEASDQRAVRGRRSPRETRGGRSGWSPAQILDQLDRDYAQVRPPQEPSSPRIHPTRGISARHQALQREVDRFNSNDYYLHEYTFARCLLQSPAEPDLSMREWLTMLAENDITALRIRQRFLNRALVALYKSRTFFLRMGQHADPNDFEYAFANAIYLRHYNRQVSQPTYFGLLQNYDSMAIEIHTIYMFVANTPWGQEGVTEADDVSDLAPFEPL